MCQNHKLFNFVKPKKGLYNNIGKHLIWKEQNIFFLLLENYATNMTPPSNSLLWGEESVSWAI